MLCERCKLNEATFHHSVSINGQTYETNLCSDCANLIDFTPNMMYDNFRDDIDDIFNFSTSKLMDEMLYGSLFNPTVLLSKNTKKCSKCGSTFSDFLKRGQLGCDSCYDEFQIEIRDMLENMDNPTDFSLELGSELGKLSKTELDKLNDEFNKAIEEERYEDAGEIKKKINLIRDKNNKESD